MTTAALTAETVHAAYRTAMAGQIQPLPTDPDRPIACEDRGSLLDVMISAFRPTVPAGSVRRRPPAGISTRHCVVWPPAA
jgi:hypothetical protein